MTLRAVRNLCHYTMKTRLVLVEPTKTRTNNKVFEMLSLAALQLTRWNSCYSTVLCYLQTLRWIFCFYDFHTKQGNKFCYQKMYDTFPALILILYYSFSFPIDWSVFELVLGLRFACMNFVCFFFVRYECCRTILTIWYLPKMHTLYAGRLFIVFVVLPGASVHNFTLLAYFVSFSELYFLPLPHDFYQLELNETQQSAARMYRWLCDTI